MALLRQGERLSCQTRNVPASGTRLTFWFWDVLELHSIHAERPLAAPPLSGPVWKVVSPWAHGVKFSMARLASCCQTQESLGSSERPTAATQVGQSQPPPEAAWPPKPRFRLLSETLQWAWGICASVCTASFGAARAFLRVHSEQEFVPREGFFAQLWMCRHGRSSWRFWLSCRDVLPEPWVCTSYCRQHNSVSNVTLLIYPGLRPGTDFYVHNTILEILILKNMPQTCSLF